MYDELRDQAARAAVEICDKAGLDKGTILVVGCSSSEVHGSMIGTDSDVEIALSVFAGIYSVLSDRSIYLAAQCCEHLNRAIIIEREAVKGLEIVNVVPKPKAGGAFATIAYEAFNDPVAVEEIKADAGLDIGDTLIGMHIKKVAVPVRLSCKKIGDASVTAARSRPKYVGGGRAVYDDRLA